MPKSYKSLSGLVKKIKTISDVRNGPLMFRGHSNVQYNLVPSLLRNESLARHERELIMSMISESPSEFSSDILAFEKLVRAQHYGIPTRLLDITSNPLIGIYFACQDGRDKSKTRGQVRVLEFPEYKIKFFDSDSVSCKANLVYLHAEERAELWKNIRRETKRTFGKLEIGWQKWRKEYPEKWEHVVENFNKNETAQRLVQFIKQEKPYFENRVDPLDLIVSDVVVPKMNNARLSAQAGRFIVYGLQPTTYNSSRRSTPNQLRLQSKYLLRDIRLDIDHSSKAEILAELSAIGIDERTVFPELEKVAASILSQFRS